MLDILLLPQHLCLNLSLSLSLSLCLIAVCLYPLSRSYSLSLSETNTIAHTHSLSQRLWPRQTHTLVGAQRSLRKGSEKLMFHICSHRRSHIGLVFKCNHTLSFLPPPHWQMWTGESASLFTANTVYSFTQKAVYAVVESRSALVVLISTYCWVCCNTFNQIRIHYLIHILSLLIHIQRFCIFNHLQNKMTEI